MTITSFTPVTSFTCPDPEGGQGVRKNHKNIGFLSNTGLDPLKNNKTTKPVFNVGPSFRRMAENGFAPPPREFCRHILSCRELKAESFKRCLHSVLRGVSL